MATFNSLPFEIHHLIIGYLWPRDKSKPVYGIYPVTIFSLIQESNRDILPLAVLNHTWRAIIQQRLWKQDQHIIAPFEITVLRELLEKNPALAGYIQTITVRSRARTPQEPLRKPDEYTHDLVLNLEPDGVDTLQGAKIHTIWREILLLHRKIRLLSGQRPISIRFFVNLGKGKEYRFVDLPTTVDLPRLDSPWLPKLTFEIPRARHGDQLSMNSVQSLLSSVGSGLKDFHLICTDIEESRSYRRELYVGLCNLVPALLPNIAPNLTRFKLTYPSFTPFSVFEDRIYPLTLLDGNVDLLSRALRILSKQLVSFRYYGGRVSSELFSPLPGEKLQPAEFPNWPYLQVYIVHFAPITPSGVWMFQLDTNSPETLEPLELLYQRENSPDMTATDHKWIDPAFFENSSYLPYEDPLMPPESRASRMTRRYRLYSEGAGISRGRNRATVLVKELMLSATNGMVGRMPQIRYWNVSNLNGTILKFDYAEQGAAGQDPAKADNQAETHIVSQGRGRPRLHFDPFTSPFRYKLSKAIIAPWRKAFRGWIPGKEMAMPALEDIDMRELSLEEAQDSASGMEPIRRVLGLSYSQPSFLVGWGDTGTSRDSRFLTVLDLQANLAMI